jgi:hypothetical protein
LPTTIPAAVSTVSPSTPPITTVWSAKKPKIGTLTHGANRPTLLASTLPPSKPHVPITKTATFTG